MRIINLDYFRKYKSYLLQKLSQKKRRCIQKLLYSKIKKNIVWNDGFIGFPGQYNGNLNRETHKRIQTGYANIFQDRINICFSGDDLPNPGVLKTGKHLFVGFDTYFSVHEDITIGDNVLIAAQCYISSTTHECRDKHTLIQHQSIVSKKIKIGDDVWIGCKVVIMPGVTIGNGAVIGAGSFVNKSIPDYEIWAGTPAKKIAERK